MIYRRKPLEVVFEIFNTLIMLFLACITLYPLLHVAMASISDGTELIRHRGLLLWPQGLNFSSYRMVFNNPMIVGGYLNTIYIVVVGVAINIFMTALGAYFLSRKGMFWKKYITLFIVFTMFFGGGMIPFYLTVKGLGLTDTLWALIIPTAVSTYNMIIMRTSFESIPESLEESARLDGAGDYTVLFKIILPLSMPVIAVMILYYGVAKWNSWFHAMIFLRKRELYPLQLILRELLLENNTTQLSQMMNNDQNADFLSVSQTIKYATIMVATIPILCIYPFLQKYFTKGVLIGAVKG